MQPAELTPHYKQAVIEIMERARALSVTQLSITVGDIKVEAVFRTNETDDDDSSELF